MRCVSATICSSGSAPGVKRDDPRRRLCRRAVARCVVCSRNPGFRCRRSYRGTGIAARPRCRLLYWRAFVCRRRPRSIRRARTPPRGSEKIELIQRAGRPIPADSRSNDLWFQHLAIVVSDIDKAYAAVRHAGAMPISRQPQLLPAWNPNVGGIRAVYFRDPDGHPLELIQFPPDKGEPRWQEKRPAVSRHRP